MSAPRASSKAGAKAAKKNEMAERRKRVAAMVLARVPQWEIAKKIGVDNSTISTDMKAVREEWRQERAADVNEIQARDLAALEQDEGSVRRRLAGLAEEAHGERVRYHELVLRIMDRRAKLIGLDAPQKVEQKHTGDARQPITIEYVNDWRPNIQMDEKPKAPDTSPLPTKT